MNSYKPIETDWDYQSTLARRRRYMSPSLSTFVAFNEPVILKKGEMQYVYDEKGKKYLDCLAQNLCVSVGHCHPFVNAEVKKQIDQLCHSTTTFFNAIPAHFAEELTATFPAGEEWVAHFVNSGSEANDLALLMARLYTGNNDMLALRDSYHGLHFGAMGLTGVKSCRHKVPLGGGVVHVSNPNTYRGMHGAASEKYLQEIDEAIATSTPGEIAGIIIESIQGFGGVFPMPEGYLAGAFERVRAAGGVCIIDEVQTGFGRTGANMWEFMAHGVTPDIIVMGKGIGNGYPLSAVVARREVAEAMVERKFFNTYGSNPMSCSAGRAVLRVIEEDNIMANVTEAGDHLAAQMVGLMDKYEVIGDFRGRGLMRAVEFVKDRSTKEPGTAEASRVQESCRESGVIVGRGGRYGNILRINPPLCANKGDMQLLADALEKGCSQL